MTYVPSRSGLNKKGNLGRTGHWRPEMAEQVYELCLLGYTNKQLAAFYGISLKVIEDWVTNNQDFVDARDRGRDQADAKVARALYERAIGYMDTIKFVVKDPSGAVLRTEETTKRVHGETGAALKWLAMRHRGLWTDTQKSEHTIRYSGEVDLNILQDKLGDKSQFTNEDLKAALKLSLDKFKTPGAN